MKICFIVNDTNFFIYHKPLIKNKLLKQKHSVLIYSTQLLPRQKIIFVLNSIIYYKIPLKRKKYNILNLLYAFYFTIKLMQNEHNSIFHLATMLPMFILGLLGRIFNQKCVFDILSGSFEKMLCNHKLQQPLRQSLYQYFLGKFTLNIVIDQTLNTYYSLLSF